MTDNEDQPGIKMPRALKVWILSITGIAVTLAFILLAAFIRSDVTRIALPAIIGAIGTISLAVVTVWLSISERAHQDELRRADETARRREADHQREIKQVEERAASERQRELELAASVRQARRVAAFGGYEGPPGKVQPNSETMTLVNGSDYPIFDISMIGARSELLGGPINHSQWPPEMRLEGESLHVAVLLPGERHVFRGNWKWRKGFTVKGGTINERRATYTWTDDQGTAWQRDGSEPPKRLPRPWVWGEFWGDSKYTDELVHKPDV